MDAPPPVPLRMADRDDHLVELFAALALIAPDQDSVGRVLGLAADLDPNDEPAVTGDEQMASAPSLR